MGDQSAPISAPQEQRALLLVPGQVESDVSIQHGAGKIKKNLDLLRDVRARNPDAFIIYKPHPDLAFGRPGHISEQDVKLYADRVLLNGNMAKIMLWCDEVHTMTSLAGFEALIRGKKVVCYGMPFYAGWGLTRDMKKIPRRDRLLRIEELAFGALVLYPRYIDPCTGLWCTPEIFFRTYALHKSKQP